jgi:hypothetical protein
MPAELDGAAAPRIEAEANVVTTEATIERVEVEKESHSLSAQDRRKTPRFPCEGTGEVLVLGGALRFTGWVRNLSATGCCMLTKVIFPLERGTAVEVTLVVNRIHFRVAAGVRANHSARCVGLEFMDVSSRCARLIQDLIVELNPKAEPELVEAAR